MELMIYAILSLESDSGKLDSILTGIKGISGADLYSVSFNATTAIVSDINRTDLIANSSNAIAYAGVIETLAQQYSLLPMRFGSIMESTGAILRMLERNHPEIEKNLLKVKNKVEFGLKVFCDSEKLKGELIRISEAKTARPPHQTPEPQISVFREYVNKKLEAHKLEEMLLAQVDSVIAGITNHLDQLNAVCKFRKMVTETMIIDAVILLENSLKDPLIHQIEEFQIQFPGLNFVLTGPWPPYNFVETTIK